MFLTVIHSFFILLFVIIVIAFSSIFFLRTCPYCCWWRHRQVCGFVRFFDRHLQSIFTSPKVWNCE